MKGSSKMTGLYFKEIFRGQRVGRKYKKPVVIPEEEYHQRCILFANQATTLPPFFVVFKDMSLQLIRIILKFIAQWQKMAELQS